MNIKLRTKQDKEKGGWYLDIIPPIYMEGNMVIEPGKLYFQLKFPSQEDAYNFGRKYLSENLKVAKEAIDKITYE